MAILRFEANNLPSSLAALDSPCRTAFAVACSLRAARGVAPSEPLAESARLLAAGFAHSRSIDRTAAKLLLAELEEAEELDRDDVACSYYALAAAVTDSLENVVWAAQRAYDAKDAQAQKALNLSSCSATDEESILQRPEVQNELRHQAEDLASLKLGAGAVAMVILRAQGAA